MNIIFIIIVSIAILGLFFLFKWVNEDITMPTCNVAEQAPNNKETINYNEFFDKQKMVRNVERKIGREEQEIYDTFPTIFKNFLDKFSKYIKVKSDKLFEVSSFYYHEITIKDEYLTKDSCLFIAN